MKKIFAFAVVLCAAMTVNAQDKVVKDLSELGVNYIDFSTEGITSATTIPTSEESTWFTCKNGAICKGFKKSDGTEAGNSWNVKEGYQNTFLAGDMEQYYLGVDSVKSGTVFRAASGSSIALSAVTMSQKDTLFVFWQPNGTSSRGVKISVKGGEDVSDAREFTDKAAECVSIYLVPAGTYAAGDIVVAATGNTVNIQGIKINGYSAPSAVENNTVAAKAVKKVIAGQLVIEKNGVRYNALGAKL